MKRILLCLCACILLAMPAFAGAELQRNPFLDAGLSLVEEGNLFLERYNQLTGAEVKPVFALGLPYFYGGRKASTVFSQAPQYVVISAWTSSPIYYRAGTRYVMGFDCTGFTQWVFSQAGMKEHPKIGSMVSDQYHERGRHLFCSEMKQLPPLGKIAQYLQFGDLLAAQHGRSYHVMMYAGTLADYGFTAEEVPELAPYLTHPLVIHCSAHPAYGERFETFIKATGGKFRIAQPNDGGVAVSLLCTDASIAPHSGVMQKQEHHWFELDEGRLLLNVVDLTGYDHYAWVRYNVPRGK